MCIHQGSPTSSAICPEAQCHCHAPGPMAHGDYCPGRKSGSFSPRHPQSPFAPSPQCGLSSLPHPSIP